jgi:hypothetical protein
MKKLTIATLTILTLILTACGSASSSTLQVGPGSQAQTLPAATQLIVGIFKLDGTDQAVTAEQAKELLPLWQVYQDLLTSDTAAQEEIDALVEQAQETMTAEQMQAITVMNLTQKDVMSVMQEQGLGVSQRSNMGNGNGTTTGGGGGFSGPPDGGGVPMGAPPDGGGFGGEGFQQRDTTQRGSDSIARPAQMNPASLLLDPLIEFLKTKAGSN